jgi:hypothetical protein
MYIWGSSAKGAGAVKNECEFILETSLEEVL